MMTLNLNLELLEIIERQKEDIAKKDELIKKLVLDNSEKENLINELLNNKIKDLHLQVLS